jgi:ferredoxin
MKIVVDRVKCSGIGLCEMSAPDVFEVGDDAQTHVVGDPDAVDRAAVEDAVANCPTSALSIEG